MCDGAQLKVIKKNVQPQDRPHWQRSSIPARSKGTVKPKRKFAPDPL